MSSFFSIFAGELEVVWSFDIFGEASVDLANVDGGVDIAMPMFSRTEVRLSAAYVAFEAFKNAMNGSFGDAHIDIHALLCKRSMMFIHSLLPDINHLISTS